MTRLSASKRFSQTTIIGTIEVFPGIALPSGWLLCDGSILQVNEYTRLYEIIGDTYNLGGESIGEFRIPDCRGCFLRGLDNGRGIDVGRQLGNSYIQQSQLGEHIHDAGTLAANSLPDANHPHPLTVATGTATPHTHTTPFIARGGRRAPAAHPVLQPNSSSWSLTTDADDPAFPESLTSHSHPTVTSGGASTLAHTHSVIGTVDPSGGPNNPLDPLNFRQEVRPRNVAMNYMIKV